MLVTDDPSYVDRLESVRPFDGPRQPIVDDDLFLLVFTSGSTGLPKAVRCTQGRLARTGAHVASITNLTDADVVYSPLPFFHTSSLFTGWAATLNAGVPIATRRKFSASRTMDDVRRYNATMLTYTGKVLNYILAVPEAPDDATVPLRLAIGNEASLHDIATFAERFGCNVRDSYGATEGVIVIRRDPAMPAGALGQAADSVKVLDPETKQECAVAVLDEHGRVVNVDEADRRDRRDPADVGLRGLLQERGRFVGAVPRRLVLVGRPRLPRRRRMVLFRRTVERVAARRRRELLGRSGRSDHRPPSGRALRRGVRRSRRSGR